VSQPFVIALVALLSAVNIAHAAISHDASRSVEERLLLDAADGTLDQHELLAAALVAGGTGEAETSLAVKRFRTWLQQLNAEPLPSDARARAELVFMRLHGELLRGDYHATCSDIAVALDSGDFNCLSATILFVAAARQCGLRAVALATEGHVLCEIEGESGWLEIETTCPHWFRLTQADAHAVKKLRLASQPRDVRRLSDVELLAKVYYNRGVAALRENAYATGVDLSRTSLRLDPHDAVARGNVLAGLNNWALALCRAGNHTRAAELLAELRELEPNYPTLVDNEAHIERAKSLPPTCFAAPVSSL
jgi:tetratricopeptide (TPR) repeat protein